MGIAELMSRLSPAPSSGHDDDESLSGQPSPRSDGSSPRPRSTGSGRARLRMFASGDSAASASAAAVETAEADTPRKAVSDDQKGEGDHGLPLCNQTSSQSEKGRAPLWKALVSFASKDKEEAEEEEEDVDETAKVLMPPNYKHLFTHRRFPYDSAFTRADWAKELVAVPDNGIREELNDMYSIFAAMERRPTMLTGDDVALFVDWFRTFLTSLQELFYLEEECLYAWIDGTDMLSIEMRKWGDGVKNGRMRGALSAAKRMRRKGEIVRIGNQITTCQRLFERRPIAEGLPVLASIISPFVDELVAYIDLKRDTLPAIIEMHLEQKDRVRFERGYWELGRAQPAHETTLVLATRWMGRRQMRKWRSKYFGAKKGVYGKWKTAFLKNHHGIVSEFANRVKTSEEERLKQMQEGKNAHAMAQLAIQNMPPPLECSDSELQSGLSSSCASSFRQSNLSSSAIPMPTCA